MKTNIVIVMMLVSVLAGCSRSSKIDGIYSPDGKSCVSASTREKRGMPLPPEGAKILGRWLRITVNFDGRKVHDTGEQEVEIYQAFDSAFDAAWAPDSSRVAYRMVNALKIVCRDGSMYQPNINYPVSQISSFKWTSSKELLVVVKGIDVPSGSDSLKMYQGYTEKANEVKIVRVEADGSVTERFSQNVGSPVYIFHSSSFQIQEISPFSDRVAFSDGSALCVYDDSDNRIVAKAAISGRIDGVWWETKERVIIGIRLLSASDRRIVSFDLSNGKIQDRTNELLPLWAGHWDCEDWFRSKK